MSGLTNKAATEQPSPERIQQMWDLMKRCELDKYYKVRKWHNAEIAPIRDKAIKLFEGFTMEDNSIDYDYMKQHILEYLKVSGLLLIALRGLDEKINGGGSNG